MILLILLLPAHGPSRFHNPVCQINPQGNPGYSKTPHSLTRIPYRVKKIAEEIAHAFLLSQSAERESTQLFSAISA
jgi:hypothetical protein